MATLQKAQLIKQIKQLPDEYLPELSRHIQMLRERALGRTAEKSFERGWKDMMNGEVHPIDTLWEDEGEEA